MHKPKKRSQQVDNAIKMAHAKLAQKHFERALESIGSLSDLQNCQSEGMPESSRRMSIVQDYLERAGAEATRYYFKG